VTLLEKEPELARIAAKNVERNGLAARVRVVEGEVGLSAAALRGLGLEEESFDHVMANPPFHEHGAGTLAPDALKAGAHAMPEPDLERWARFMARMAAPGGGATVIHKGEALARLLGVLEGRFGGLKVLPLYPRASAPAHRIIVQGIKGSRALPILLPGFVLHGADDAFTPEAQAILRTGAALPMAPAL
jgi:tRNA1(Val) A37 N6-methylase TrmN6